MQTVDNDQLFAKKINSISIIQRGKELPPHVIGEYLDKLHDLPDDLVLRAMDELSERAERVPHPATIRDLANSYRPEFFTTPRSEDLDPDERDYATRAMMDFAAKFPVLAVMLWGDNQSKNAVRRNGEPFNLGEAEASLSVGIKSEIASAARSAIMEVGR